MSLAELLVVFAVVVNCQRLRKDTGMSVCAVHAVSWFLVHIQQASFPWQALVHTVMY